MFIGETPLTAPMHRTRSGSAIFRNFDHGLVNRLRSRPFFFGLSAMWFLHDEPWMIGTARRTSPRTCRRKAAFQGNNASDAHPRLDGRRQKRRSVMIWKDGSRMMTAAMEAIGPFPAAATGAGLKMAHPRKRALIRNIPATTLFIRFLFQKVVSPSEFRLADNRTCRTTEALLFSFAGALLFLSSSSFGQVYPEQRSPAA
jgi:hypothetical protein